MIFDTYGLGLVMQALAKLTPEGARHGIVHNPRFAMGDIKLLLH